MEGMTDPLAKYQDPDFESIKHVNENGDPRKPANPMAAKNLANRITAHNLSLIHI